MALDATLGGTASNSYIDVDTADTYHDSRLHNDDWFSASIEKREVALKWATNLLDVLDWKGIQSDAAQALSWPRTGVYSKGGTELTGIPKFLAHAVSEYAWELMKSDRTVDSDNIGITQVVAGEVSVKFDKSDRPTKFPSNVMRLIEPYLGSNFSNFVSLQRV